MATITLNVTTTQDQNDGSSFQGLSLRDASLIANNNPSNEYIINLPAGTYDLTIKNVLIPPISDAENNTVDQATLFRSRLSTGDLDITGNVTIIGVDPATTIINAGTLTQPLPVVVDPNDPFPENPPTPTPTIGDRVFDVISSTRSGKSTNGNLVIQNVTIKNGTITEDNVDAVFTGGTINGGAINIDSGTTATFINSVIADSKTTLQGGGINNQGTLTLNKTIVSGHNSGDNAGGIYNTGTLTIRNSAIINNLADAAAPDVIEGGGGGVLNEAGATLIMVNTTVSGNKSASGTNQDGPGDVGGGILSRGITRIINSTIVNNSAQVGSGIYSETTTANTILYNTIVGNNTGSPDLDGFFDNRSAYNLVTNANGSILDANNGNIVGGATTGRVELFIGPLQNNGGTTPNHALLPGSPAIDAGDNSMVNYPLFFPDTPALDQRGSERISNGKIDIGAYEVFVAGTTTTTTTPTNTTNTAVTGVNPTTNTTTTPTNTTNTAVTGVNPTTNTTTTPTTPTDTAVTGVNPTTNTTTTPTNTTNTAVTGANTTTNTTVNITDASVVLHDTSEHNTDSLLNAPIYRFQNRNVPGTYLYTGTQEAQNIRTKFSNFKEEGFAFHVAEAPADNLIAMYRFQNSAKPGTYLYAGEQERQSILSNNRNFIDEGVAFYVYGADANKGQDIYRFQSLTNPGTYLFAGETEKNNIIANFSSNFTLEGVAFEVG
ncbi:choice-of-anchor Q domain-containing protein [Geminocystis sp. GBBB08]|uniref:choice-of-anchor Q domain-containing protein n=1 Tax=Geminocystis sp. GBBB08 TaxID=2604140 RepID=UPI0027E32DF1|nr:choice-of-anchor Q domain-containing protein [Geminocystis sp. GBBB08]